MDPKTLQLLMGSSAAGAAPDKNYIEDVFSTWLYTGNGSTQTITNGIDLSGKGGLVWIKNRSIGTQNALQDTARGANNWLVSDQTFAQLTTAFNFSFDASGFSQNNSTGVLNTNGNNYVSWSFRKQAKFFDIVTYTGNGVAGRTINHNLGSTPGCIIIKNASAGFDWLVWHRSSTGGFFLNTVDGDQGNASYFFGNGSTYTAPTSTTFTLGNDGRENANGNTYVAYIFAHDAGGFGDSGNDNVISCGSLTTDSTGEAIVTLGWEAQWILAKQVNSTGNWLVYDTLRGWDLDANDRYLIPNLAIAEGTFSAGNPTSTGFKLRDAANQTYIYIAIRRGPMKTPTDATKVFSAVTRSGTSATATISSLAFPTDGTLIKTRTASLGYDWNIYDRLRGATKKLATNSIFSESTEANGLNKYDSISGYALGTSSEINSSSDNFIDYNFRRAPGFFDVVAFTGTGSARTQGHNLGVVPQWIIAKRRDGTNAWGIYYNFTSTTYDLVGFSANTVLTLSYSNGIVALPTSTGVSVGTGGGINNSTLTYLWYLFATCPGVSKVGSYTGTGTTLNVDCGFTNGARFVLIKRTDSTGDWYVWDTARGIISGNDSYLLLNSTAAEVTTTDYIDPLSSGFQISSTAPAAINASGGSFIFLAVA